MAGIYIHIPFCRQKCYYCDFYKIVNTSHAEKFISALKIESKLRQNYLENETVETIYFGGGTPSVLNKNQLADIFSFLHSDFIISNNAEITFEANPDDLTDDYLTNLSDLKINRLSIGIQSFEDDLLKKMNRRHNAEQAIQSINRAQQKGFNNLSIDFIYGLPNLTSKQWKKNLELAFSLPVQHISAYHLTYHEGTPFYTWLKKGTLKELNENESLSQFNTLLEMAENAGFEMYEISNFAKDKMYSRHNSSYWKGNKYIGLGPSAHSFNGISRQWNFASLEGYLKAIDQKLPFYEKENLTEKEKFNEYILTRIRTKWGVDLTFIENRFGMQTAELFIKNIQKHLQSETIIQNNEIFILSKRGLFISDEIMTDLMII